MIRKYKTKNIIEIGSGNSSKLIGSAVALNKNNTGEFCNYIVIDPYPNGITQRNIKEISRFLGERIMLVDFTGFEILKENDI